MPDRETETTTMTPSDNPTTGGTPRPKDHPLARSGRIGVLLLNLGTPDGTDYWSMRRYLKQFLSDRRVIEDQGLRWKLRAASSSSCGILRSE